MVGRSVTWSGGRGDRHNGGVADDAQPVYDPAALDPEADVVSRRRARKWWWALGGFAFVVVLVMMYMGRQSETEIPPAPKAFCVAANAYEEELERQQIAYRIDTAKQIERVADIAATAPRAVKDDAELFLRSLREIDAAPDAAARAELQDDPEVKAAVDEVNRYWNQGCGVFEREGGI
jgi:hypothetical protein